MFYANLKPHIGAVARRCVFYMDRNTGTSRPKPDPYPCYFAFRGSKRFRKRTFHATFAPWTFRSRKLKALGTKSP